MFRPIRKSRRMTGLPWARPRRPRWPVLEIPAGELPPEEAAPLGMGTGGELGLALEDLGEEEDVGKIEELTKRLEALERNNSVQGSAIDDLYYQLRRLGGSVADITTPSSTFNWTEVSLYGGKQFKKIQDAIDFMSPLASSTNPCVVIAHPGEYVEQITMAAYVSLSAYVSAGTIIDAKAAGYTVTPASNSELSGFEIRNTVSTASEYGGVDINGLSNFLAFNLLVSLAGTGSGNVVAVKARGTSGTGALGVPRLWNCLVNVTVPSGATGRALYLTGSAASFLAHFGGHAVIDGAGSGAAVEVDNSHASNSTIDILNAFVSTGIVGNQDCLKTNHANAVINCRGVVIAPPGGTGKAVNEAAGTINLYGTTFDYSLSGTPSIPNTVYTSIGAALALYDGVTAPAAMVGGTWIYTDTADGDLKVKFGDGVTKTLATDT